jgi:hypothetical protein
VRRSSREPRRLGQPSRDSGRLARRSRRHLVQLASAADTGWPMESGQLVRIPLRLRPSSGRTFDQRLLLRFPWLAVMSLWLLDQLPPTARLRQTILRRAGRLGIEAFNRRDFEVARIGHHTDCEYLPPREMIEAGLAKSHYRGPAGYRELMSDWSHAGDLQLDHAELIDLGDRWVLLAALSLKWHRLADPSFSRTWASVLTLKSGRPIREQYYWNDAEAYQAAGLGQAAEGRGLTQRARQPDATRRQPRSRSVAHFGRKLRP